MINRLMWWIQERQGIADYEHERAQAPPPPPARRSAPGMDDADQVLYAQRANRLVQSGLEAPGVIHSIAPTGGNTLSGGKVVELDVTFRPSGGEPIETTITQVLLPAQLEELSTGQSVTVRYDPEHPGSALLYGW